MNNSRSDSTPTCQWASGQKLTTLRSLRHGLILSGFIALLLGCSTTETPPDAPSSDSGAAPLESDWSSTPLGDPPIVGAAGATQTGPASNPNLAKFPFTVNELREGNPVGLVRRLQSYVERRGISYFSMRVIAATERGVGFQMRQSSASGAPIGSPQDYDPQTWEQLQAHASHPLNRTTVTRELLELPLGTYECSVYRVQVDDNTIEEHFYSKSLPGVPLLYVRRADGKISECVKMIEVKRPAAPQPTASS